MGQSDMATHGGAAVDAMLAGFAAAVDGAAAPVSMRASETLVLTELTHWDRTFAFNRGLVVRVLDEGGGWAFESDNPELMGFGHTRDEAEASFCFGFALNWDQMACEDDERLTLDAIELKRAILTLVKIKG
jgi:hypothetical protein